MARRAACRFGFLYAKDTYEGEVLSRLFTKIERQIKARLRW